MVYWCCIETHIVIVNHCFHDLCACVSWGSNRLRLVRLKLVQKKSGVDWLYNPHIEGYLVSNNLHSKKVVQFTHVLDVKTLGNLFFRLGQPCAAPCSENTIININTKEPKKKGSPTECRHTGQCLFEQSYLLYMAIKNGFPMTCRLLEAVNAYFSLQKRCS